MSTKLELGINANISNSDYHAEKLHLSSSNLKLLLKSPKQFYTEKILGIREPLIGSALDIGTYVHSLVLEPEKVQSEFAIYTGWKKQGAEFQAFKAQNSASLPASPKTAYRRSGRIIACSTIA
jgi:hypothetical protein